ncbi:MAG: tetratricopeptide repeat protein [Nitrospiraceae bacterium]
MRMSLQFPIAVVLSIVPLAVPAWADYKAGEDAYNRSDYATALHEWQPLAEQGDSSAQVKLGTLYVNGQGVSEDYQQALYWFRLAAKHGNAMAQTKLGLMYERGNGVTKDFILAHKWYILGAANGDKLGAEFRDALAKRMTPAQIFKAQQLALEGKPKDSGSQKANERRPPQTRNHVR